MAVDIEKVAKLAHLPLTDTEKEMFSGQLSQIITFIEKLNTLNLEQVEPTFQVTGKINASRIDMVGQPLSAEEATQNAPNLQDSYIVTKGVFENE
ncbi:Asp-tRNA(Asn)/Glu-tRNA(Gln) amidotransferase subunit GatC [candidate division WWE3 bacterium]|nr:Asp-tRNA(Asn)/Glu-tRNA(Gln) amidotransferase subunit GatC [candidate division WWE3 bacterium]